MDKKGEGGVSRFSVESFLFHIAEKFCRWTLLCCVSESFRQRKSLWIRGEGECQDFRSKIFCLTVPKKFVEEPFCVSENLWFRKMLGIREGAGITIFRQNCFVSQYRKTRRGTFWCFKKFLVSKYFMVQRDMSRISVENFLSYSTETFRRGTLRCCVSEIFR